MSQQMIDAIASQAMGVQPQQPVAPTPPPKKPDSAEDKASASASPQTEGDRSAAEAIIYEIEFGEGDKRQMTPNQIKSMAERYASLNYKHARYKPVLDLMERLERDNPNASPKEIIEKMSAIAKGGESNPTMGGNNSKGNDSATNKQAPAEDMEAMLKKWEEENAASLPPGYKEMMMSGSSSSQAMQQMQQQLAATQRMLQAVLSQTQGVADAAAQGFQQGNNQQVNAVRQTIANNLDRVSQHLQLPDDKANDFMMFAAERGFTLEDFADPQLTIKVMTDYKNNMSSPEMERLRSMASRRQAFTGSMGSTPTSGAGVDTQPPGTFDNFAQSVLSKKGFAG
jgi:hypothetical protein